MLKIWESLEIRILLRVAMFSFDRPHDTIGRRFWRKCEDGVFGKLVEDQPVE